MCGIAGILRIHQPDQGATPPPHVAIPEPWLDLLDDSVKHRGPDGQGRFRDRATRPDGAIVDVALVHRRLAIIDHATGGQPMVQGRPGPHARLFGPTNPDAYHPVRPHVCPRCQARARAASVRERSSHPPPFPTGEVSAQPTEGASPISPPRERDVGAAGREGASAPAKTNPNESSDLPTLLAVVFNGCIYNHRELRHELEAAGHVFETDHSDTEVILHGWREWRTNLPDLLESMHAMVIWDSTLGECFASRDRYGEKPLHHRSPNRDSDRPSDPPGPDALWLIASSPNGVARIAPDTSESSMTSTRDSLLSCIRYGFGIPRPDLCTEARPRSSLLFRSGARHAAPVGGPALRVKREHSISPEEVESDLRRAVADRLEADVPVGCFLSGGVDSSLVAALAMQEAGGVRTFSVRMPDDSFNESGYAAVVARHVGSEHTTLECGINPAEDLSHLIQEMGQPFGDSSLLPTYWVSRAAREHVKVALTGDGADELFAGYNRYLAAGMLWRAAIWLRHAPAGLFPARNPQSPSARLRRLVQAARHDGYRDLISIFPTETLNPLVPAQRRNSKWNARGESMATVRPVKLLLYLGALLPTNKLGTAEALDCDLAHYLPDDLLRKVDVAAMSVGLETRCPYLDSRLAARVRSASMESLMPDGQRKGLLRAVARKHLPVGIVDRPKQGFAIPIGEWFRSDFGRMRQLLYDHLESADPFPGLAEAGLDLDMNFVRRMLREHDEAGERSLNPWHGRDHSQRLYMLLVLSIWSRWLASLQQEPRP